MLMCTSFPGPFTTAALICWAVFCAEMTEKYSTATWCESVYLTLIYFFKSHLSQADAIYNMVGYPEFIMNTTKLDKVFNDVGKCGSDHTWQMLCHTFASLQHWTLFFPSLFFFSLKWCQSCTSKMSCSTTTFQLEWQRTSWGKLQTETSELLPVALIPHCPACQRGGCRDKFPLYWLSRILLPSTNVPRQQTSLRWTDPCP